MLCFSVILNLYYFKTYFLKCLRCSHASFQNNFLTEFSMNKFIICISSFLQLFCNGTVRLSGCNSRPRERATNVVFGSITLQSQLFWTQQAKLNSSLNISFWTLMVLLWCLSQIILRGNSRQGKLQIKSNCFEHAYA